MLLALTCVCVCLFPHPDQMGACFLRVSRAQAEWAPCEGSTHGATWVEAGQSGWRGMGTIHGQPWGFMGTLRKVRLSPAVSGMAATEGDVLHLEEVAAMLKLEQRWQMSAKSGEGPAPPHLPPHQPLLP